MYIISQTYFLRQDLTLKLNIILSVVCLPKLDHYDFSTSSNFGFRNPFYYLFRWFQEIQIQLLLCLVGFLLKEPSH